MGMFDSLYVRCRECKRDVEFQSKAGDCVLRCYSMMDVPADIAGDLIGQQTTCECGNTIRLRGTVMLIDDQYKN